MRSHRSSGTSGESPYAVHRDLQKTMQSLVGIFRTREDVSQALVELETFSDRWKRCSVEGSRMFNPGWHLALDLKSMLTISEAVAKSALVAKKAAGRTAGSISPKSARSGARKITSSVATRAAV